MIEIKLYSNIIKSLIVDLVGICLFPFYRLFRNSYTRECNKEVLLSLLVCGVTLFSCQDNYYQSNQTDDVLPIVSASSTNDNQEMFPLETITNTPNIEESAEARPELQLTYLAESNGGKIGMFAITLSCPEMNPPCFSEPRMLFEFDSLNDPLFRKHSWSPNYEKVVFAIDADGMGSYLFIADSKGTDLKNITENLDGASSMPSWSPDGKQIAFTLCSDVCSIRIISPEGQLIETSFSIEKNKGMTEPSWAPDGFQVACTGLDESLTHIQVYIANLDSGEINQLTNGELDSFGPSFSPDSQRIIFVRYPLNDRPENGIAPNIMLAYIDGTSEVSLMDESDNEYSNPAWAPIEDWIAFMMRRENGGWDIYIMRSDGTNIFQVTHSPETIKGAPAWRVEESLLPNK